MHTQLQLYGYTDTVNDSFLAHDRPDECVPARVLTAYGNEFAIMTENGRRNAVCTGRMLYVNEEIPVTGDWVIAQHVDDETAVIHSILPRTSVLSRVAAGKTSSVQGIAANVDTAFLVMGLDGNYSINRLQRYIAICMEGGITPVCVLNKSDLCDDPEAYRNEVHELTGIQCLTLSAKTGEAVSRLREQMNPGRTYCLLGSSGAGKSTLLNALSPELNRDTSEVRMADSKGRHTTTRRELFQLADGSIIIDTPGMRELKIAVSEETLDAVFNRISDYAEECRFDDCSHTSEPGCAVLRALESDEISYNEYDNYIKLRKESDRLNAKGDVLSRLKQKRKERQFGKIVRDAQKTKRKITGK
ncbi:MAG: ribosome small subunit-dependent GTPase A [Spirochaetota bacterium]